MAVLEKKIDFALVFSVKNANPNGDPLSGNMPRVTINSISESIGEVSDVCLKRKIRDRLLEAGENIFVQSDDNRKDAYKSLKDRAVGVLKDAMKDNDALREKACKTWIDVRSFGQVFPYKGKEKGSGLSLGIRGPVTIQSAFSLDNVNITSIQITKSVNNQDAPKKKEEEDESNESMSPDRMGMKHRVDFGLYATYGSMNPQLAEKTGFSYEDAQKIKRALLHIFDNDASAARPEGSMEVVQLCWWEHSSKSGQYSSAKVHQSLHITLKDGVKQAKSAGDYAIAVQPLAGLEPEIVTY
ncbi:MAG: type I-C CRISPR-associated protein Cas7/Csd2 [Spirochaetaceae bacterium]|jgi:CRISPR-associated protein Csd2|nr:type I-C CRISPR-associated protein Cas7/Csd2 [Spirochaetaceae bacterium]